MLFKEYTFFLLCLPLYLCDEFTLLNRKTEKRLNKDMYDPSCSNQASGSCSNSGTNGNQSDHKKLDFYSPQNYDKPRDGKHYKDWYHQFIFERSHYQNKLLISEKSLFILCFSIN